MTAPTPPPPADADVFEPAFVHALKDIFEQRIPFNQLLGLRIDHLAAAEARGHFEMRPELVGHFLHQRLHGGVVSAALDNMGAIAAMAAIGARHLDEPVETRLARFSRLGTIDLRIDYLRQGTGPRFTAAATVLRLGSRVASTRMELHDAQGRLVSAGSAAYIVS